MPPTEQKPIRHSFSIIICFFLVGSGLGSFYQSSYINLFFVFLIFSGVVVILFSWKVTFILLGGVLFFTGFWWAQMQLHQVILTQPFTYEGKATLLSLTSSHPPTQRAILQLQSGPHNGKRVRTTVYDWTYESGTTLSTTMLIEPSTFTSDQGSSIIGMAREVNVHAISQPPNRLWVIRHLVNDRVAQSLPEPYASLAVGLLTGAGDSFDSLFKSDLRTSGTTHLVAVSGYNMTLVALFVSRLLNRFGRYVSFIFSLGIILFYYFLTGMSPAVARGAIFTLIILSTRFLGRPAHAGSILILTAFIMTLFWPLGMIYSLSWQLSFLAFIGILYVEPLLRPVCQRVFGRLGPSTAETLGAQIPVLPLLIYTFGVVSLVAPLTNILVLSLTPFAMLAAAFQAIVVLISPVLATFTVWFAYPILWLIVSVVEWSSQVPFASMQITSYSLIWCLISYSIILSVSIYLWYKTDKRAQYYEPIN